MRPCPLFHLIFTRFFKIIHRQIDHALKYGNSHFEGIYSIITLWKRRIERMKNMEDEIVLLNVNAWACLFRYAKTKNQIYITEYPRYLDKENRWFRLRLVYTIGLFITSWPLNSNDKIWNQVSNNQFTCILLKMVLL